LVFEKNANFFAENCQKWQKIEIVTSAPQVYALSINASIEAESTNARPTAFSAPLVPLHTVERVRKLSHQSAAQLHLSTVQQHLTLQQQQQVTLLAKLRVFRKFWTKWEPMEPVYLHFLMPGDRDAISFLREINSFFFNFRQHFLVDM
jgi:hypothetical protein